jgi:hypothetical protein
MRKCGGVLAAALMTALSAITPALAQTAPAPAEATAAKATSVQAPGRAPAKATKRSYARTRAFDGLWSVSIMTRDGPCAPSYRYPARILNGRVVQVQQDFSYQIAGIVTNAGGISVMVSSGGQSATGYGRLNHTSGGGWWRAAGGTCSGVWSAARRSL